MQAQDSAPRRENFSAGTSHTEAAVIGPSIEIEGDLRGEEDLVIEGKVKGTVRLKTNNLTIGSKGKVTADVYAHTIYVDGFMKGDLYASERVVIRKTAKVQGNIAAPRVSLEEGARFKGSIEMDPEAETLKSAFGATRSSDKAKATGSPAKAETAGSTSPAATSASSGNGSGERSAKQSATG